MMRLAPVMERLRAVSALGFRTVDGIEALGDVTTAIGATPAAYVTPAADSATPTQSGTLTEDLVSADFEIAVVIDARGQRRGGRTDELADLTRAVRELMFGWSMPGSDRPLRYVGGRLFDMGAGKIAYVLKFRAVERLRQVGAKP